MNKSEAEEKLREQIASLLYSFDDKPFKAESHYEMADRILNLFEPVQLEVLSNEEIITTLHWREAWVKAKSIHLRRLMKATNARNEAKFGKLYRRKE